MSSVGQRLASDTLVEMRWQNALTARSPCCQIKPFLKEKGKIIPLDLEVSQRGSGVRHYLELSEKIAKITASKEINCRNASMSARHDWILILASTSGVVIWLWVAKYFIMKLF